MQNAASTFREAKIKQRSTKGSPMPRYAITERAGRFVAGHTNTGVGTVLTLTEKQAEHELRLGTLRALVRSGSGAKAAVQAQDSEPAPLPRKGGRRASRISDSVLGEADRAASADLGADA